MQADFPKFTIRPRELLAYSVQFDTDGTRIANYIRAIDLRLNTAHAAGAKSLENIFTELVPPTPLQLQAVLEHYQERNFRIESDADSVEAIQPGDPVAIVWG
jgi:hypothetical protein